MVKQPVSEADILAQIPAAVVRAERARRSRPHAEQASYGRAKRALTVRLTNGVTFTVPVSLIPSLAQASDADLAAVEVDSAGIGLHWERMDMDLSVAALARLVLGPHTLLKAAGTAGGLVRSSAKARAARENGKKGGRPRKRAREAAKRG